VGTLHGSSNRGLGCRHRRFGFDLTPAKRVGRSCIQRRVPDINPSAEWLEADGLGGYASGTVGTLRTRRYHGVRITATTPPTGRVVLVAGLDAVLDCGQGPEALCAQRYTPGVIHPQVAAIESFALTPWPTWTYLLSDGTRVRAEIVCTTERARTLLRWTRIGGSTPARLRVRPLLAARDYHSLQHENAGVQTVATVKGARVAWRLYDGAPEVACDSNGTWIAEPAWYRQFLYVAERERGLDAVEDLFALGSLEFDLGAGPAVMAMGDPEALSDLAGIDAVAGVAAACERERARRLSLGGPIERAADQYLVRRGIGRTLVAGYPWFTDWGRDTFIALRGLCLAAGRLDVARDILLEWATASSRGMLPNRFPDAGEEPEFNAVDASLWYVVAAGELLVHADGAAVLSAHDRAQLESAISGILEGYARGTRYGIRCDGDGLLAAGVAGVQLTWMDAKVGDRVITPRIGKPVEVQALWINALETGSRISQRWHRIRATARESFNRRFWNEERQCLFDVVDVDHVKGRVDGAVRPNQIFAVGGLPSSLLPIDRARAVVDAVQALLWTPLGLRSLAPTEPAYAGRYAGGPAERDAVYHQGTVWPWLMGPFVEAWLRVRSCSAAAKAEAGRHFIQPIERRLVENGLGHLAEVADAEPPHVTGGCPFQAWSLGEFIRARRLLDIDS
jgi:predicted glycogen debranching enzyme